MRRAWPFLLIFFLLTVSCENPFIEYALQGLVNSNEGGSPEPNEPTLVLFEKGEWNPVLGDVYMDAKTEYNTTGTILISDGNIVIGDGPSKIEFTFGNILDASKYNRLVIQTNQNELNRQNGWWVGGELFTYNANALPDEKGRKSYGFYESESNGTYSESKGTLTFTFSKATVSQEVSPNNGSFAPELFNGFSFMNGSDNTIT